MKDISVTFTLNEEHINRFKKLLPFWRNYISEDGSKPFENYTVDTLFETIMQTGSYHIINSQIENEEYRQRPRGVKL